MRDKFRGFYSEKENIEDVLKSGNVRIVLDTNVLLSLYRVHDETREQLLKLLAKAKDKIWIPYHVALEYQRNRLAVIKTVKDDFKDLEKKVDDLKKTFKHVKEHATPKRFNKLGERTEQFEKDLNALIGNYKKSLTSWHNKQLDISDPDPVRPQLDEIFSGSIGEQPEKNWLQSIQKDGEARFKCAMPPGFCDASKGKEGQGYINYDGLVYQQQFGDLIIWKQAIKMASEDDAVKSVIFVTNDTKEDWIHKVGSSKTGVRAELRAEMCSEGKVDSFFLLPSDRFFELASKVFAVEVDEAAIDDVKTRVIDTAKLQSDLEKLVHKFHRLTSHVRFSVKDSDLEHIKNIKKVLSSDPLHKYIVTIVPKEYAKKCFHDLELQLYDVVNESMSAESIVDLALDFVANYRARIDS